MEVSDMDKDRTGSDWVEENYRRRAELHNMIVDQRIRSIESEHARAMAALWRKQAAVLRRRPKHQDDCECFACELLRRYSPESTVHDQSYSNQGSD